MQSRSAACMPARSSAWHVASRASETPVSPSDTQWRVLIPERCAIHSSDVSIMRERSSFETTRSGTWKPVAMNSVRGMDLPCGDGATAGDVAPESKVFDDLVKAILTHPDY